MSSLGGLIPIGGEKASRVSSSASTTSGLISLNAPSSSLNNVMDMTEFDDDFSTLLNGPSTKPIASKSEKSSKHESTSKKKIKKKTKKSLSSRSSKIDFPVSSTSRATPSGFGIANEETDDESFDESKDFKDSSLYKKSPVNIRNETMHSPPKKLVSFEEKSNKSGGKMDAELASLLGLDPDDIEDSKTNDFLEDNEKDNDDDDKDDDNDDVLDSILGLGQKKTSFSFSQQPKMATTDNLSFRTDNERKIRKESVESSSIPYDSEVKEEENLGSNKDGSKNISEESSLSQSSSLQQRNDSQSYLENEDHSQQGMTSFDEIQSAYLTSVMGSTSRIGRRGGRVRSGDPKNDLGKMDNFLGGSSSKKLEVSDRSKSSGLATVSWLQDNVDNSENSNSYMSKSKENDILHTVDTPPPLKTFTIHGEEKDQQKDQHQATTIDHQGTASQSQEFSSRKSEFSTRKIDISSHNEVFSSPSLDFSNLSSKPNNLQEKNHLQEETYQNETLPSLVSSLSSSPRRSSNNTVSSKHDHLSDNPEVKPKMESENMFNNVLKRSSPVQSPNLSNDTMITKQSPQSSNLPKEMTLTPKEPDQARFVPPTSNDSSLDDRKSNLTVVVESPSSTMNMDNVNLLHNKGTVNNMKEKSTNQQGTSLPPAPSQYSTPTHAQLVNILKQKHTIEEKPKKEVEEESDSNTLDNNRPKTSRGPRFEVDLPDLEKEESHLETGNRSLEITNFPSLEMENKSVSTMGNWSNNPTVAPQEYLKENEWQTTCSSTSSSKPTSELLPEVASAATTSAGTHVISPTHVLILENQIKENVDTIRSLESQLLAEANVIQLQHKAEISTLQSEWEKKFLRKEAQLVAQMDTLKAENEELQTELFQVKMQLSSKVQELKDLTASRLAEQTLIKESGDERAEQLKNLFEQELIAKDRQHKDEMESIKRLHLSELESIQRTHSQKKELGELASEIKASATSLKSLQEQFSVQRFANDTKKSLEEETRARLIVDMEGSCKAYVLRAEEECNRLQGMLTTLECTMRAMRSQNAEERERMRGEQCRLDDMSISLKAETEILRESVKSERERLYQQQAHFDQERRSMEALLLRRQEEMDTAKRELDAERAAFSIHQQDMARREMMYSERLHQEESRLRLDRDVLRKESVDFQEQVQLYFVEFQELDRIKGIISNEMMNLELEREKLAKFKHETQSSTESTLQLAEKAARDRISAEAAREESSTQRKIVGQEKLNLEKQKQELQIEQKRIELSRMEIAKEKVAVQRDRQMLKKYEKNNIWIHSPFVNNSLGHPTRQESPAEYSNESIYKMGTRGTPDFIRERLTSNFFTSSTKRPIMESNSSTKNSLGRFTLKNNSIGQPTHSSKLMMNPIPSLDPSGLTPSFRNQLESFWNSGAALQKSCSLNLPIRSPAY